MKICATTLSSITGIALMLSFSSCGKSDEKAAEAKPAEAPKAEAPKTEAPKPAAQTAAAPAPKPAPAAAPTPAPAPAPAAPKPVAAAAPAPAPAAGPSADEKAAIERFKTQLMTTKTEVEALMKEGAAAAATNPMAQLVPMKALCAKMQAIKTDGLPADLKEAWDGMAASFGKMADLFKDFPDKPDDMGPWIVKNVGSDPAKVQQWSAEFGAKLAAISQGGDAAEKKLTEVAQKYGIDPSMMK
jgi:hypothetical protein